MPHTAALWTWICSCGFSDNLNIDERCKKCGHERGDRHLAAVRDEQLLSEIVKKGNRRPLPKKDGT